jgi:broad specificity phosphatase PhoE
LRAMTSPILYLIRHGQTDWNAEARLQGQRDIPLNAFGRVQPEEAARRLQSVCRDLGGLDYVASPLWRSRETMERVRETLGLDPAAFRVDGRLKEISFGSWEGLTWRELRDRDAPSAAARQRDKWNYVPPGGESYRMLADRVEPAIKEISRDTVIVSHGGVARVVLARLCAVSEREAPVLDILQGRVLVVERGRYRWV